MKTDAFSAMSRRWPGATAKQIRATLDMLGDYVRVSTAKQGAARYPYWGAVRYRIEVGARGVVVARALHAAGRDRRSEAGAERDADAMGLPWLPTKGAGAVNPEKVKS